MALDLNRRADGVVEGKAEIPVTLKNFSGNFVIAFAGGDRRRQRYLPVHDREALGRGHAADHRRADRPHRRLPAPSAGGDRRVRAQRGRWVGGGGGAELAPARSPARERWPAGARSTSTTASGSRGRAMVIVDGQGHVTVIGKITPRRRSSFRRPSSTTNARSSASRSGPAYGIPVVGNVFLFAGVGAVRDRQDQPADPVEDRDRRYLLDRPRDLQQLQPVGEPEHLRARRGPSSAPRAASGIEIARARHQDRRRRSRATAGIRAYVDATPVIGYRELADPTAGRRGEFYIHGEAEIAAQPFLALAGELFVKLVTPWWSPCPDHTWTWPLGRAHVSAPRRDRRRRRRRLRVRLRQAPHRSRRRRSTSTPTGSCRT